MSGGELTNVFQQRCITIELLLTWLCRSCRNQRRTHAHRKASKLNLGHGQKRTPSNFVFNKKYGFRLASPIVATIVAKGRTELNRFGAGWSAKDA